MSTQKRRAPRHTLDRDTIAAAALDLMDSEGLGALTIRALATRLGVAPMALYNHAATKDEILDAARERALAPLAAVDAGPSGPDGDPWWQRLRRINIAFHSALRDHPSLVPLLVSRPLAGPTPIGAAEAQVQVLLEAGFAPAQAASAHLALLHYAIGHAAWTTPRVESPAESQAALVRLPVDRYPMLHRLAEPLAAATHDPDQYARGLDLLLDALRHTCPSPLPAPDAGPVDHEVMSGQPGVSRS
ncbi:MAG TPA: TetR/AcrR family transcriptional regulator C-terminal domain-containing protein [Pilimelia sp.]|nr:TetR/AcrR family transcriptional regulator C-terminal domain-containing protein [Pilimelia sp.]